MQQRCSQNPMSVSWTIQSFYVKKKSFVGTPSGRKRTYNIPRLGAAVSYFYCTLWRAHFPEEFRKFCTSLFWVTVRRCGLTDFLFVNKHRLFPFPLDFPHDSFHSKLDSRLHLEVHSAGRWGRCFPSDLVRPEWRRGGILGQGKGEQLVLGYSWFPFHTWEFTTYTYATFKGRCEFIYLWKNKWTISHEKLILVTIYTFFVCNHNVGPQDVNSLLTPPPHPILSQEGKFIVLFTWPTYISYSIDGRTVRCCGTKSSVATFYRQNTDNLQYLISFDARWTWAIFLIFILFIF